MFNHSKRLTQSTKNMSLGNVSISLVFVFAVCFVECEESEMKLTLQTCVITRE